MPTTTLDLSPIWALLHQHLLPGEDGHCITIVGALYQPRTGTDGVRRLMESDARDVWMLSNRRILLLRPKKRGEMTLRDELRLARGDLSAAGAWKDWPRSDLLGCEISSAAPAGASLEGDARWLRLSMPGRETYTLLDDASNLAPQLEERLNTHMHGATLSASQP